MRVSCSLVPFVPYKATRGGVGSQDLFHNNVTSEPPFVCIVIPCLGWTTYLVYVCGVCVLFEMERKKEMERERMERER